MAIGMGIRTSCGCLGEGAKKMGQMNRDREKEKMEKGWGEIPSESITD